MARHAFAAALMLGALAVATCSASIARTTGSAYNGEEAGPKVGDETVNTITLIAYTEGWTSAYLHYNPDSSGWNGVPGDRMSCPSGAFKTAYPCTSYHEVTVLAHSMVFVTTDGSGQWNNNNGHNYNILTPGTFLLAKNDSVINIGPPVPPTCPGSPVCSDHGTCDTSTGTCTCSAGWYGSACEDSSTPAPGAPQPGEGMFTLLYQSSWSTAYLHYNPDNKGWNGVPGAKMACPSGKYATTYSCSTWREISVAANTAIFVLTDGSGQWDNNGGQNYDISHAGVYTLSSGKLTEITPQPDGCPGNCSNHGTCDTTTGTCTCHEYYYGSECSKYCPPSKCPLAHEICDTTGDGCTCEPGWGKCSSTASGCDTNLNDDVSNCGSCGKSCNSVNVASATCSLGHCNVTCNEGFTQCDDGTCAVACPLPGCETYVQNNCVGDVINTSTTFADHDWQTPDPSQPEYRNSYQSLHALRGHARLVYTADRQSVTVMLVAQAKNSSTVIECGFNYTWQSSCDKVFHAANATGPLHVALRSQDQTLLTELEDVDFHWDHPTIVHTGSNAGGDYRDGQKGAIIELFGWRHIDIEQECEFISKAGYLGVKFFPAQEQVMSSEPFNNVMNPWYFMYQPVSYRLQGRMGSRDELRNAINTCRRHGVRAYADAVVNHMVGSGNDGNPFHRNDAGSCVYFPEKNTSADYPPKPGKGFVNGSSPFYTQGYVYEPAPGSGKSPMQEFPSVPYGPLDFHCQRALNSWTSPLDLNAGWLVGLVDLNTEREYVRQRIADYMTDLLSIGFSGFRIDAAKHMRPPDLAAIFGKLKQNMGGTLPPDFITYLEVLTGGEGNMLLCNPDSDYSYSDGLQHQLSLNGLTATEINQIKIWYSAYPKQPGLDCGQLNMQRKVIENDDADQQNPGSTSRDMQDYGTVLVIQKNIPLHQHFEEKLFNSPRGASDNDNDYPIRLVLSSYWLPQNPNGYGMPDGNSECDLCTVQCDTCDPTRSMNFTAGYKKGAVAYSTSGRYTRTHRFIGTINAMRSWMHLQPMSEEEAADLMKL